MNAGTEPHELPIGIVLSEKHKEILMAARTLEEALGRHNMTIAQFSLYFYSESSAPTVDIVICRWQQVDDKRAKIEGALGKLSDEDKDLLGLPHSSLYLA